MSIHACDHVPTAFAARQSQGCEACVALGDRWVHLRLCVHCGHIGCCDSSKNRHATRHAMATQHVVVQSVEPGEDWLWCHAHQRQVG